MATRQELERALRNADAAGDANAARQLAQALKSMQAYQGPSVGQLGGGSIADTAGKGVFFGFGDELAGATGALVNQGAKLFGGGTDIPFTDAYKEIRDVARRNEAAFADRNPKTALASEIGGGLLTGGAGLAKSGAVKGAQGLAKAAGLGAAQGGLYGLGASDADTVSGLIGDTASGGIVGGAIGAAIPAAGKGISKGLSKLLKGKRQAKLSNQAYDASVGVLDNAGVPLSTGQRLGSEGLKATEGTLSGMSLVGRPLSELGENQKVQFQKQIMRMAGFNADDAAVGRITDEAMENAQDEFSKRFAERVKGEAMDLTTDDQWLNGIVEFAEENSQLLDFEKKRQVGEIIDQFIDSAASGPMSGQKYLRLRSNLTKKANTLRQTDPVNSGLYRGLRDTMDDAFSRATKKLDLAGDGGWEESLKQLVDADSIPANQKREATRVVDDYIEKTTEGVIDFGRYQDLVQDLTTRAERNPAKKDLLNGIKGLIEDRFEGEAGGAADIFQDYARFKQIQKLARSGGGQAAADGILPLASLESLSKRSGNQLKDKDWRSLINAGAKVLPHNLPNSGTAPRAENLRQLGGAKIGSLMGLRGLSNAMAQGKGQGLLSVGEKFGPSALLGNVIQPQAERLGARNYGLLVNPFIQAQ